MELGIDSGLVNFHSIPKLIKRTERIYTPGINFAAFWIDVYIKHTVTTQLSLLL